MLNSPPNDYPQPIPVVTGTNFAYRRDDRLTLAMVRVKKKPEELLLPGGIFVRQYHVDPIQTAIDELQEEAGLRYIGKPVPFGIALRSGVDRRTWCSLETDHCIDLLLCGPVEGTPQPEDMREIEWAGYVDLRTLDMRLVGRGQDALVSEWIKIHSPNPKTTSSIAVIPEILGFRVFRLDETIVVPDHSMVA